MYMKMYLVHVRTPINIANVMLSQTNEELGQQLKGNKIKHLMQGSIFDINNYIHVLPILFNNNS